MPTLQKLFTYRGDAHNAPLKSIDIEFKIPVFDYSSADSESNGSVDREIANTETLTVSQALNSKHYRVVFGDEFAIGKDGRTFSLFKRYYWQSREDNNLENLVVGVTVQYLSDKGYKLAEEPLEFIYFPKLDLDAARNKARSAADPFKKIFIAVNKAAFFKLREQLVAASAPLNEIPLMEIISYLTDLTSDEPGLQKKISAEMKRRLFEPLGDDSVESTTKAFEIIKTAFPSLYDFPLSVPELNALNIAGKFTIVTADKSKVSKNDFLFYDLSAEFSASGSGDLQILHYAFGNNLRIHENSTEFSFSDDQTILRNSVASPVFVKVKGSGSLQWSKEFMAEDPLLARIQIEVPLQQGNTRVPVDKDLVHDKTKKLRGQALELSKKCPLKDLTVVIQARAEGDTLWRIVGAATTDSAGNFSMPYPFGIFTEAQALVSATPDTPAIIRVTAVREGNQTIADDFLYLLIKDMECPHVATEEECDCHAPKKPSRLPDQADLIGSDEYSQDMGGTCVNLSTPNRTLSEFNYQAIVRTSDPDVANYTLKKVDVPLAGIGLVPASDIARAVSALDIAIKNPLFGNYYLSQKLIDTEAKVDALRNLTANASTADLTTALGTVDAIIRLFNVIVPQSQTEVYAAFKTVLDIARELKAHLSTALVPRTETHYELVGGVYKRVRKPVDLDNPVAWQDAPDDQKNLSLYQAVTVATGHILHYKSVFKADGYSLGDLIYSLPLAPGQKKEIVVFDSSHTLAGAESQSLSQGERLAAGIVDERDITNQLGGRIAESLRGSSSANTSGISAGFGTGGSGSGGTGAYGGSGSAVLGVAGGVANANSTAAQDSSRDVSQFFGEKLRQSIMQNAEGYRQLNASVVTTVQEGQRYGVTSEVVANHNHCHALTMMYFEVLRHYAIFQELSSVEECVFVPLLMTNFTTQNIYKWRDVLAKFLLPMPSETYLQPFSFMAGSGRQHPLLKAFDANERIKTNYANVDFPQGSYDDEQIQFVRGTMRVRVELPRPRTRFDRIMSLPITTQTITTREIDPEATAAAALEFPRKMAEYAAKVAATAGMLALFDRPPNPPGLQYSTTQHDILVRSSFWMKRLIY